ncbi:MAG TPA: PKD domain-containing protein, partial [Chryseolinea sp.]|nr:PKD domain-containing protein [Chryseolinea sp.]
MKYSIAFLLLVFCSVTWFGCGSDPKPKIEPSNLVVEKTISIDGSGLAEFMATADDAVKFQYSFGDGTSLQNSTDGAASHNYINSGTYNVKVFAFSIDDLSIDKTISVTIEVDEPEISDEGYSTPESYNNMSLVWQDEFNG